MYRPASLWNGKWLLVRKHDLSFRLFRPLDLLPSTFPCLLHVCILFASRYKLFNADINSILFIMQQWTDHLVLSCGGYTVYQGGAHNCKSMCQVVQDVQPVWPLPLTCLSIHLLIWAWKSSLSLISSPLPPLLSPPPHSCRHDGLIIMATNRPYDLDEAMHRRIMIAIEFRQPDHILRKSIWESHIPETMKLDSSVDLVGSCNPRCVCCILLLHHTVLEWVSPTLWAGRGLY